MKTKKTGKSVSAFLDGLDDVRMQTDCRKVARMMREATGARASMWGSSIVGFGRYRYRYESGREGEWFLCGFSPRKRNLAIYIMPGFASFDTLMARLGKYKTGKSCLYAKRLDDVDEAVLRKLIDRSVKEMRRKYPT